MSIRQRNAHFTDWAAVCRALNVNTESEARTALESSDNTFYYYVCYIKSTKEIYTHGQFYKCSGESEEILDLINALTEEIAENEEVTAIALSDLNENKASKGEVESIAISKQDTITDLDSIRTKANNAVQPDQISNFVSTNELATVATTGNFNDLLNIPDILTTEDVATICYTGNYDDLNNKPTPITETTINDWGFTKNTGTINEVQVNGSTIATTGVANISAATTNSYGVTKLSSDTNSTSTTLAATSSAVKSVYDLANGRQEKLVSGTNIKTINNTSILGSGNITIDANIQAVDTSEILDDVETNTYVKYVAQTLTEEQKAQARTNIGVTNGLKSVKTLSGSSISIQNMEPNIVYIVREICTSIDVVTFSLSFIDTELSYAEYSIIFKTGTGCTLQLPGTVH